LEEVNNKIASNTIVLNSMPDTKIDLAVVKQERLTQV
jgi:hypothetical protein